MYREKHVLRRILFIIFIIELLRALGSHLANWREMILSESEVGLMSDQGVG